VIWSDSLLNVCFTRDPVLGSSKSYSGSGDLQGEYVEAHSDSSPKSVSAGDDGGSDSSGTETADQYGGWWSPSVRWCHRHRGHRRHHLRCLHRHCCRHYCHPFVFVPSSPLLVTVVALRARRAVVSGAHWCTCTLRTFRPLVRSISSAVATQVVPSLGKSLRICSPFPVLIILGRMNWLPLISF